MSVAIVWRNRWHEPRFPMPTEERVTYSRTTTLRAAIEKLPKQQRAVMNADLDGYLDNKELAEELNTTVNIPDTEF